MISSVTCGTKASSQVPCVSYDGPKPDRLMIQDHIAGEVARALEATVRQAYRVISMRPTITRLKRAGTENSMGRK